ncbi:hypothetical protein GJU39_17820 [Pedobacter petrophilus]|uniref:Uncharacterized protein n=1 Tax=Pedobacter petrophilus TaxID=1908241 RepID=A0A7K0G2N6_9SPHI|nr:hypothetical protein [Pedobacter petrophilus]
MEIFLVMPHLKALRFFRRSNPDIDRYSHPFWGGVSVGRVVNTSFLYYFRPCEKAPSADEAIYPAKKIASCLAVTTVYDIDRYSHDF